MLKALCFMQAHHDCIKSKTQSLKYNIDQSFKIYPMISSCSIQLLLMYANAIKMHDCDYFKVANRKLDQVCLQFCVHSCVL